MPEDSLFLGASCQMSLIAHRRWDHERATANSVFYAVWSLTTSRRLSRSILIPTLQVCTYDNILCTMDWIRSGYYRIPYVLPFSFSFFSFFVVPLLFVVLSVPVPFYLPFVLPFRLVGFRLFLVSPSSLFFSFPSFPSWRVLLFSYFISALHRPPHFLRACSMRIPLACCLLSCVLDVDFFSSPSLFSTSIWTSDDRLFHPVFFLWVLYMSMLSPRFRFLLQLV